MTYKMAPLSMERFERLSSLIYDLIEDINADRVGVHSKMPALNSLHLLRDSLVDLRFAYSLVIQLAKKRVELMERQVTQENFSGELHEAYHEASGQLRAVTIAFFQLGKRTLNNSSYVFASFLPHGIAIKDGSFGKQYESVKKIKQGSLDERSKALVENLLTNGAKLEIHNDARDMYIEHAKPATKARQRRPVSTGAGINYMKEKVELTGIQEHLYGGMVRGAGTDFVVLGEKDTAGNEVRTYHIHIAHLLMPMGKAIVRSAYIMRPPDYDPDHFKKLEPHTHSFAKTKNDEPGRIGSDYSIEITELATVEDMVGDYCGYIEGLLKSISKHLIT